MSIDASNRKYFVDVFGDYVNDVRALYDSSLLKKPYYLHGHPIDINSQLVSKNGSLQFKKYPLIALLQDFAETWKEQDSFYSVSFTCLIVVDTLQKYTASKRYEMTFKPVLYQILDNLITVIKRSPNTSPVSRREINYTKTDRVYWGVTGIQGNDGLLFTDKLDCIELNFQNLQIKKHC